MELGIVLHTENTGTLVAELGGLFQVQGLSESHRFSPAALYSKRVKLCLKKQPKTKATKQTHTPQMIQVITNVQTSHIPCF